MTKNKIKSASSLKKILSKRGKKKIVFTNGVFDILHAGHVQYLEKARSLGDALVVAVNSDASVKRLKGPTRPINGLKDRQQVLAALECVTYVISFGEDTPLKVITELMPNVLVKGADYKISQIVGAKEVLENGGQVKTLTFLKGRSTTNTIRKIGGHA